MDDFFSIQRGGVYVCEGGGGRMCSFYIKNKINSEIFNDKKVFCH